jgi:hypothetical protein
MKNKIFITIFLTILITSCGFSPIYISNQEPINILKIEIIGDKNLAFELEKKLNFIKKEENSADQYSFKAQIYDSSESSLVDSRGIATEEIIKLTVSYQFENKNGITIYQDSISKDKRVTVTDNIPNNNLVKSIEKRQLLDSIVQNILFKTRLMLK